MQTATSENNTPENKTSEAISEKYRDTEAGIYLRLMTYEDTDRVTAMQCVKTSSTRHFLPDSLMRTGSGPMWRPGMWCR